jgi:trehalose synthase
MCSDHWIKTYFSSHLLVELKRKKGMSSVSVGELSLGKYSSIIGEDRTQKILALAENLVGKTVCHVNSTSFGGGVAEILHRLVPLMRSVGLEAEWKLIEGSDDFFNVTKALHNGLQGMPISLTDEMKKTYLECNEANARKLDLRHEFVVIHDPQPAAIVSQYKVRIGKWIWRCHIDLSNPHPEFINFLTPILYQYDSLIFTAEQYVQEPLKSKKTSIVKPSIDPLSDKNKPISQEQILSVLNRYDINPERPIITQVSRFDPWKDPLGVIDVYRIVKRDVPNVQLLLIASMSEDDPEGWIYHEKTARHAGEDYDIHLLTDLKGVGDEEVNAFQRASNVVLQKSIREGFGLSVTEALWKEVPVVGSNVGGIPLQIIQGENGFLVNSIEEAAEKTLYLLKHPEEAKQMGKRGKEHVLENFLITRHLADYLKLFNSF